MKWKEIWITKDTITISNISGKSITERKKYHILQNKFGETIANIYSGSSRAIGCIKEKYVYGKTIQDVKRRIESILS
jgi:hypothetical protein